MFSKQRNEKLKVHSKTIIEIQQEIEKALDDDDVKISSDWNLKAYFLLSQKALFIIVDGAFNENKEFIPHNYPHDTYFASDISNDLIQLYKTKGTHILTPNSKDSFWKCFIFSPLTNKMTGKNIDFEYHDNIFLNFPQIESLPILTDYLKKLIERKKDELKKIQEKRCLDLIKELLLELEPNNEVLLEEAIEVVKEEDNFSELRNNYIQEALLLVANNLKEFKYIRLIKSIRRQDVQNKNLTVEIDKLLSQFEDSKI